jgi:hypothetical protein
MRKFWKGVAVFFAVVFAIAFVSTTISAQLLTSIDRRLLNSATYKNALESQQVYGRLSSIIAEQMVASMNYDPCKTNPLVCESAPPGFLDCAKLKLGENQFTALTDGGQALTDADREKIQPCLGQYADAIASAKPEENSGPPAFIKSLDAAQWKTVITKLVPAEELRSTTEDVLDQIFAYFNGQRDSVAIPLTSLKTRLLGPSGVDALMEIVRAQPPCTPQQYQAMQAVLDTGEGEMNLCRPSEENLPQLKDKIRIQLDQYVAIIPDEKAILSPDTGENTGAGPFGGGLSGGMRLAHLIMRLSPDLPLLFLLLITLLVVRSPRSWMRWWGIPFFIAGVLAIGTTMTASAIFDEAWLAVLADHIPPYLSTGLVSLARDLARSIFQTFLGGITLGGVLLILLGLGAVIGSFFVKEEDPPAPTAAPISA